MDRSPPMIITPELTLRLASTVRVSGRVSLGGHAAEEVTLSVHSSEAMTMFYELVAPVAADGSFTISGVQRGQLELATRTVTTGAMATTQVKIDTRRGDVTGVRLVIPSTQHTVNVIVRSQTSEPTPNAQVYILPGTLPSQTMDRLPHGLAAATVELCRPVDERSPPTVRALARTGDLFASSASAIEGASTACALGLPSNLADADLDHNFRTNMAKLQLICKPVPPTGEPVLLEVPPWPRLE